MIFMAAALSMDAFAVSVCNGTAVGKKKAVKTAFYTAAAFGAAQGAMPIIGYILGHAFLEFVIEFDHWIALVLLCFIGGKMVKDTLESEEHSQSEPVRIDGKMIAVQAVATSIDALAVGISLAVIEADIFSASAVTAAVTFAVCFFGCLLGKKLGEVSGKRATLVGGLVLIAIGVKIFCEHIFYWF